ncbi:MAG TPA: phytanoyl-CoA dioxygenase family protein [Armatimonadota bacterium]|jgi:ectoine hydroxylase-related dioxygenase (phytanoyl-CoA dioxygenase family)
MPTDAIREDLSTPYELTPDTTESFRRQGFIKLKHVLAPETLAFYGDAITREVMRLNQMNKPMEERTTYEKAFLQIMNLWPQSEVVRELVFSRKLAGLAAGLMGVRGIRLYHDQALYKEPGGGFTPWHADQYYWPLSTPNTCTVWIPFQPTPLEMGPLAFSVGSHLYRNGRDLEISDESEARISKALLEQGLPHDEAPYDLGELSFHLGWTFHHAGGNRTQIPRRVMTVIYMEDGICLAEPRNKNQVNDWNTWLTGAKVGEPIDTPLNPVLFP